MVKKNNMHIFPPLKRQLEKVQSQESITKAKSSWKLSWKRTLETNSRGRNPEVRESECSCYRGPCWLGQEGLQEKSVTQHIDISSLKKKHEIASRHWWDRKPLKTSPAISIVCSYSDQYLGSVKVSSIIIPYLLQLEFDFAQRVDLFGQLILWDHFLGKSPQNHPDLHPPLATTPTMAESQCVDAALSAATSQLP